MSRFCLTLSVGVMFFIGCSPKIATGPIASLDSLLSQQLRSEIRKVEKSVVGVTARIIYDIQTYEYVYENDRPVSDPASPVGYRLDPNFGEDGILHEVDDKLLSGGGLLLAHEAGVDEYVILTSNHLVAPADTVEVPYFDERGQPTDFLFQRRIVKDIIISVRGTAPWKVRADLVASNPTDDLALLRAESERFIAQSYNNPLGYDLDLTWGDWVFMFGYPREIKQLTGGWVSESPYRGTFAVDAVVRFGFSGGPVFALANGNSKLAFVGVIKSVPSETMDFIAPGEFLPSGYRFDSSESEKLLVRKQVIVNYGTAYCVEPVRVRDFLISTKQQLDEKNIKIHPRFFAQ